MGAALPLILALDLGTTNLKAALVDAEGRQVALARRRSPVEHPSEGRWELSMDALVACLGDLVSTVGKMNAASEGLAGVVAICIVSQANSFVLIDERGKPCGPAVLWPDARAKGRPLPALGGIAERCGIPCLDHEFAVAKLAGCLASREGGGAAGFAFIGDVVTGWLTGVRSSELSVAGLSSLVDVRARAWWAEALVAAGVSGVDFAPLVRTGERIGEIRRSSAAAWGLPEGCVVLAGSLDQYATMIGAGAVTPGIVAESTGTVLAAMTLGRTFEPPAPEVYQGPLWAGRCGQGERWARMTFSSTSAGLLEVYRGRLGGAMSFAALDGAATAARRGAEVPRVRSLAEAGEMFDSISASATPGEVVLGIYERVADELARLITALGAVPGEVRSCGGGAQSRLWLEVKARRLGVPVVLPACPEATLMGAAILAGYGMGWGSVEEIAGEWVRVEATFAAGAAGNAEGEKHVCA